MALAWDSLAVSFPLRRTACLTPSWSWTGLGKVKGGAALQPSKEPLPLFLRLRGKADLLWGWVILLAR